MAEATVLTGDELTTLARVVNATPLPGAPAPTLIGLGEAAQRQVMHGFALTLFERGLLVPDGTGQGIGPADCLRTTVDVLRGLDSWILVERTTADEHLLSALYRSSDPLAAIVDDRLGPYHRMSDLALDGPGAWLASWCHLSELHRTPTNTHAPAQTTRADITAALSGGARRIAPATRTWVGATSPSWRAWTTARMVRNHPDGTLEGAWFTLIDGGEAGAWHLEPDLDQPDLATFDSVDDDTTPCTLEAVEPAGLLAWLDGWC